MGALELLRVETGLDFTQKISFPRLERLYEEGVISPLDRLIAQTLMKRLGSAQEEHALLYALIFSWTCAGHTAFPLEELDASLRPHIERLPLGDYFIREGDFIYLRRYYLLEKEYQEELARFVTKNSLSLVTGGPGTGKSTHGVEIVKQCLKKDSRILITAPTGKAAEQLYVKVLQAVGSEKGIERGTLHSFLGLKKSDTLPDPASLFADLILVDEASMLDLRLMLALLRACAPPIKLVLLGDPDQLPPVEPGAPFHALVRGKLPIERTHLTTSHRMQNEELTELAASVRENDYEKFCKTVLQHLWEVEEIEEHLVEWVSKEGFTLLTPLRKGKWGVPRLNELLRERLSGASLPIQITRSDKEKGLFNGEVGRLEGDTAYFAERTISKRDLPPYELAYALSVHKSQGSEYDNVLLLLPKGSERFGRELLYTGITRARKKVRLIAEKGVLQKLFSCSVERCSGMG